MAKMTNEQIDALDGREHDWELSKIELLHEPGGKPPLSIVATHTYADPKWKFILAYTYTERDKAALQELVDLVKLGMEFRAALKANQEETRPMTDQNITTDGDEFIVRDCESHDDLVTACKMARNELASALGCLSNDSEAIEDYTTSIHACDAAIAKAKGETK